jgi:hypothetical protein
MTRPPTALYERKPQVEITPLTSSNLGVKVKSAHLTFDRSSTLPLGPDFRTPLAENLRKALDLLNRSLAFLESHTVNLFLFRLEQIDLPALAPIERLGKTIKILDTHLDQPQHCGDLESETGKLGDVHVGIRPVLGTTEVADHHVVECGLGECGEMTEGGHNAGGLLGEGALASSLEVAGLEDLEALHDVETVGAPVLVPLIVAAGDAA